MELEQERRWWRALTGILMVMEEFVVKQPGTDGRMLM
jgi:hypothetical protein